MAVYYHEGVYEAEVLEHAFQMSKTNKLMLVLKIQIQSSLDLQSGEFQPEQNQYERRIYLVIPEDDQDKEKLVAKLREAGWEGTRFEDFDLIGRTVRVRCYYSKGKEGKYAGQDQENWDLNRTFESKPLESKPDLAKKLNALLGKQLKANTSKPAPKPQTVPDDIPFGDDGDPGYMPDDENF